MNRQFYALRGLAIVIVVLNHSITLSTAFFQEVGYSPPSGVLNLALIVFERLGIFAVPIFLFISGCFFAYAAQGKNTISYKVVWNGLKHILWPYLFWSIIFYIVIFYLKGWQYSLMGYIKDLIVGYPFHFVPLIVFYYLISPALIVLMKKNSLLVLIVIGLYQLFLLDVIYPGILGFQFQSWATGFTPPVIAKTMAIWAIYFPLGVAYTFQGAEFRKKVAGFVLPAWILTIGLWVVSILSYAGIFVWEMAQFLAPLAFVVVTIGLKRDQIPLARTLEKIGGRAYSLYLSNLSLITILLHALNYLAPSLVHSLAILVPLLFGLSLMISMFLLDQAERIPVLRRYHFIFG